MAVSPRAVGVMGGTFDPIHCGHLRLAEEMADAIGLEQVVFIPAGRPPHRQQPQVTARHRLEMVRRAVAGNPRFAVDDREVSSPNPSYTVDTLTALRAERGPAQPMWLLLGADAFHGLPQWKRWKQLFELANIVVVTRPGAATITPLPEPLKSEVLARRVDDASEAGLAGAVLRQQMTALDISATAIRDALARRGSVRYLLPDAVLNYINEHQLYRQT
ncbi:MAG: nicotinate-nucleotide adenylyltransferase [Thiobacillus sp.]|nr:nicotinate-nucleotide adenylyltransferase [Thiobacillus sp.]